MMFTRVKATPAQWQRLRIGLTAFPKSSLSVFNVKPALIASPLNTRTHQFIAITKHKKSPGPNGIMGSEQVNTLDIQMNQWAVESQLGISRT